MDQADLEELWYQPDLDVYLNRWFSNYEDARKSRDSAGGYLLPYKRHFFVCEPEVIRAMGLEPEDPDWEKVAWDCASPGDRDAYERLRLKREAIVRSGQ